MSRPLSDWPVIPTVSGRVPPMPEDDTEDDPEDVRGRWRWRLFTVVFVLAVAALLFAAVVASSAAADHIYRRESRECLKDHNVCVREKVWWIPKAPDQT